MIGFEPAGSACCVWRDALTTYVLSAAHIFKDIEEDTRVQWISADAASSGGGRPVLSRRWLPMMGGELDACLVEMDDPGPFRIGGSYPKAEAILPWHAVTERTVVQIWGKHGAVTAQLAKRRNHGDEFEDHVHGRLLQFRFLESVMTSPGDSGAPVISVPEAMLVGMHIVLYHDEHHIPYSLVVAAEDIRETFGALLSGFDLRP